MQLREERDALSSGFAEVQVLLEQSMAERRAAGERLRQLEGALSAARAERAEANVAASQARDALRQSQQVWSAARALCLSFRMLPAKTLPCKVLDSMSHMLHVICTSRISKSLLHGSSDNP